MTNETNETSARAEFDRWLISQKGPLGDTTSALFAAYAAGMARMREAHLASLNRIGNAIGTPTGSWGNEAERKALLDRVQKVSKLVQDEIRVAAPGAEGDK